VTLPGSPGQQPSGPDPERVLAQALHAMAGGGKAGRAQPGTESEKSRMQLTTVQVLLVAVLIGLGVGVTAGLISLLV
jgi:hypothetical protein